MPPNPPPTDAIPQHPQQPEFDAHLFWDEHKNKIILAVALIVAALVIYAIYEITAQQRDEAAGAMLAQAAKADDYKALIEKYPQSAAAGDAHLLLAKQLRDEKKYDEAAATLRDFSQKNPEHPLAHAGLLSLAETLELQGKTDEAMTTYQQVATKYPDSYSAPIAVLAQANLLKAQGKADEARRAYENFVTQFPDSVFSQEAMREMRLMRK